MLKCCEKRNNKHNIETVKSLEITIFLLDNVCYWMLITRLVRPYLNYDICAWGQANDTNWRENSYSPYTSLVYNIFCYL